MLIYGIDNHTLWGSNSIFMRICGKSTGMAEKRLVYRKSDLNTLKNETHMQR
jgi:hypothetical protein